MGRGRRERRPRAAHTCIPYLGAAATWRPVARRVPELQRAPFLDGLQTVAATLHTLRALLGLFASARAERADCVAVCDVASRAAAEGCETRGGGAVAMAAVRGAEGQSLLTDMSANKFNMITSSKK